MKLQLTIDYLINWLESVVPESNDLVVPISGGTDSALCFYICTKAFPKRIYGVYAGRELRQSKWFENLGEVKYLSPDHSNNLGLDNWEAEIARWTAFISTAIYENRILVGARNRTEQHLGTYSMASRVAWYYPIIGIWKEDVIELCKYIGIPEEILASSREADPACGRPKELARLSFNLVDMFVKVKINELPESELSNLNSDQIKYLETIYNRNIFKQDLPQEGPVLSLR